MSDNDMIRRGDVLDAMCKGPRTVQERIDAIRAIEPHPEPRDGVIAKMVEALRILIDHTHECERELTESLHHVDFCGESRPLTDACVILAAAKAVLK